MTWARAAPGREVPGPLAARNQDEAAAQYFRTLVARHDQGRFAARLVGESELVVSVDPADATVRLERQMPFGPLLRSTPVEARRDVPVGSYVVVAEAPGRMPVRVPVVVHGGAAAEVSVTMPAAFEGHEAFVFVAGGRVTIGGDDLAPKSLPRQTVDVAPFLIGRHPVTMEGYCAFINGLVADDPEAARAHVPRSRGPPRRGPAPRATWCCGRARGRLRPPGAGPRRGAGCRPIGTPPHSASESCGRCNNAGMTPAFLLEHMPIGLAAFDGDRRVLWRNAELRDRAPWRVEALTDLLRDDTPFQRFATRGYRLSGCEWMGDQWCRVSLLPVGGITVLRVESYEPEAGPDDVEIATDMCAAYNAVLPRALSFAADLTAFSASLAEADLTEMVEDVGATLERLEHVMTGVRPVHESPAPWSGEPTMEPRSDPPAGVLDLLGLKFVVFDAQGEVQIGRDRFGGAITDASEVDWLGAEWASVRDEALTVREPWVREGGDGAVRVRPLPSGGAIVRLEEPGVHPLDVALHAAVGALTVLRVSSEIGAHEYPHPGWAPIGHAGRRLNEAITRLRERRYPPEPDVE